MHQSYFLAQSCAAIPSFVTVYYSTFKQKDSSDIFAMVYNSFVLNQDQIM